MGRFAPASPAVRLRPGSSNNRPNRPTWAKRGDVKKRYDVDRHHRRSTRLRGWDYSQAATYFVTICTYRRECLLGEIVDRRMRLNACGQLAAEAWSWLSQRYRYVELDALGVMPNHLHGILAITDADAPNRRGESRIAPTPNAPLGRKTLGSLIGAFKTVSAKHINALRDTCGAHVWQRGYYDRVVRNGRELQAIREYIRQNAARWPDDPENPSPSVQS